MPGGGVAGGGGTKSRFETLPNSGRLLDVWGRTKLGLIKPNGNRIETNRPIKQR
jgi:hypothetical protein